MGGIIGASLTACHYTALKIRRGEGYVVKNFWKSFKENLKQSTVIWFVFLLNVAMCSLGIFYCHASGTVEIILKSILMVALLCWMFVGCWMFPMQSRFVNKVGNTIKFSFLMAFKFLFRTIFMIVIYIIPGIVFL